MKTNPQSLPSWFGLDGKDPLIPYKAPGRTLATLRINSHQLLRKWRLSAGLLLLARSEATYVDNGGTYML